MQESLSIQEVLRLLSRFSPLEHTDNLDEATRLLHTTRLSSKMAATTTRKSKAKSKRQRSAKIKRHDALALADLAVEAQAGNTAVFM
jgi:hypothetical protein